MRILILLKTWSGGIGTVVKNISKELEKRGHRVKIISREEDLKINSFVKSIFPIRKKVKQLMKKENYYIIYTQDWSLAFPLIFPYPIFRKQHFCMFHGNQPGGARIFQNIMGNIMGRKLVVVGDSLKKRFSKSNLVYNGVDLKKFKKIKKIKKIKNSVGFANWPTDEYNFNKIKKAVNETEKKLIVTKNIQKEKMPEFYNKIEVLISLPPEYTGFNLVWLEAMSCGVPKIIGNKAGIGKKLPIDHIEDFSSIEKAIKSSKRRNYRKWVLDNNFTWENHVNKFLNVLKKNF